MIIATVCFSPVACVVRHPVTDGTIRHAASFRSDRIRASLPVHGTGRDGSGTRPNILFPLARTPCAGEPPAAASPVAA